MFGIYLSLFLYLVSFSFPLLNDRRRKLLDRIWDYRVLVREEWLDRPYSAASYFFGYNATLILLFSIALERVPINVFYIYNLFGVKRILFFVFDSWDLFIIFLVGFLSSIVSSIYIWKYKYKRRHILLQYMYVLSQLVFVLVVGILLVLGVERVIYFDDISTRIISTFFVLVIFSILFLSKMFCLRVSLFFILIDIICYVYALLEFSYDVLYLFFGVILTIFLLSHLYFILFKKDEFYSLELGFFVLSLLFVFLNFVPMIIFSFAYFSAVFMFMLPFYLVELSIASWDVNVFLRYIVLRLGLSNDYVCDITELDGVDSSIFREDIYRDFFVSHAYFPIVLIMRYLSHFFEVEKKKLTELKIFNIKFRYDYYSPKISVSNLLDAWIKRVEEAIRSGHYSLEEIASATNLHQSQVLIALLRSDSIYAKSIVDSLKYRLS